MTPSVSPLSTEADDLRGAFATQRGLLERTVTGLTPEQLSLSPTASELCLGAILAHLAVVESQWLDRAGVPRDSPLLPDPGSAPFPDRDGRDLDSFRAEGGAVAERLDAWLAAEPDLGARVPLPATPWFPAGSTWSRREVLLHLLREIAQHSGHADLIREAIDGQKTMG
ncbi:DinB family protein [Leucobacter sp. M11]|uniref:DinB family protein n=1 Tax=Leucobacter sp. M11 TaxID=2993565 RepID=UPI002D7FE6C5|nr:DinB family protein [Leucobacter sp. M11]MEB4614277.1 DinB family protein [Leucobacter sp. M11]